MCSQADLCLSAQNCLRINQICTFPICLQIRVLPQRQAVDIADRLNLGNSWLWPWPLISQQQNSTRFVCLHGDKDTGLWIKSVIKEAHYDYNYYFTSWTVWRSWQGCCWGSSRSVCLCKRLEETVQEDFLIHKLRKRIICETANSFYLLWKSESHSQFPIKIKCRQLVKMVT